MPLYDESGVTLYTTGEAAAYLGLAEATVRVLVHHKRLSARHPAKRFTLIPGPDLEAYRAQSLGRPPGRKPTR